jgi:ADP-ribose pyrophosphatase
MERPIMPSEVRTVHTGQIFTVQIEAITLPNGHRMQAEIVRHPGSVVIIPVTDAGDIVLVRQYRPAIGRWAWEVPAGTLKPGEDVETAAIRECHEEIGMIPTRVERLGSFFPTPGYCDEVMHVFRATGLRPRGAGDAAAHPDENEDLEIRPIARDALRAMIRSGALIDLKTVAGVALLEWA